VTRLAGTGIQLSLADLLKWLLELLDDLDLLLLVGSGVVSIVVLLLLLLATSCR